MHPDPPPREHISRRCNFRLDVHYNVEPRWRRLRSTSRMCLGIGGLVLSPTSRARMVWGGEECVAYKPGPDGVGGRSAGWCSVGGSENP